MKLGKRLLLIAYNFPPLISPQSLRWFYLSKELSAEGYDVDILTIKMPERFQDLLDKIPAGIKIYRSFPGPFYYLTYRYSKESLSSLNSLAIWKIFSRIHLNTYRALNLFCVPDIYSEWILFAIQKGLKLIKANKYDVVISSSEPRVCHLVGYFIKSKTGIPWIADYGDPWIYPVPTMFEPHFKKKILERIERKILKKMDAITVSAEGIKRLHMEKYPFLDKEKVHVMTQGFDPEMFLHAGKEDVPSKFRIVYCGSLYKSLRNPVVFFEALKEIDREDVEVIIAGRINEFADILKDRNLYERIIYRGFLDHKKALALQKGATVLLHLGNASDIQVPGKIYEYFGARRPVLCIKGGDSDISGKLVVRYNKGIAVDNDKEDIKKGIMKLYNLWKSKLLEASFNLDGLEEFTWQKSAEYLGKIIEKITSAQV